MLNFISIIEYIDEIEQANDMCTELKLLTKDKFIGAFEDGKPKFSIALIREG